MTTYTVANARGRTVLPASDAATAALYRRIFGSGSVCIAALNGVLPRGSPMAQTLGTRPIPRAGWRPKTTPMQHVTGMNSN